MEERNKNKDQELRDIFRQLNEESHAADNQWNAPSDELWGNIEQSIKKDKPNRRGLWWSLLSVLFLIGFAGLIFMIKSGDSLPKDEIIDGKILIENNNSVENKNTTSSISSLSANENTEESNKDPETTFSANQKVVSAENTVLQNAKAIEKNTVKNEIPASSEAIVTVTKDTQKPLEKNTAPENTLSSSAEQAAKTNTTKSISTPEAFNNSSSKNTTEDALEVKGFKNIASTGSTQGETVIKGNLQFLPQVNSLLSNAQSTDLSIKIFPRAVDNDEDENNLALRFPTVLAGIYYAPSISNNAIRGEQPEIIAGNQAAYNWKNFGFRVEALLSKNFAVEVGIQKTELLLRSDYNITFPYLNSGEQTNVQGDFDTEFSHNLPSPVGDVSTLMALTRLANHSVPNGEDVNVTYLMNQDLEFVSLPVILKYYTSDRPLTFSLRAGIVKHFRLHSSSLITDFQSHHDAIQYRHANAQSDVQFINKSNINLLFGAGVNYRLPSGFTFFAEPSFTKALNSVFNGSFENLPFTYQLNVGVSYQLLK